jgi:hypothetical protein
MRSVLVLVALLLAAPFAALAQEAHLSTAPAPQLRAPTTEAASSAAPVAQEVATEPIRAESREEAPREDRRDQFARRGSFWWLVGVIVVAAVIVSVLLD